MPPFIARRPPRLRYGTNLMPTVWPRRQTTSQALPVLESRENASRNLAGSELESSIVIFAPEIDMSCTTQGRAAKPPSNVIHPDWRSDLRVSRFLVPNAMSAIRREPRGRALRHPALKTVAKHGRFSEIATRPRTAEPSTQKARFGGLPARAFATIRSAVAAVHRRRPTRPIARLTH